MSKKLKKQILGLIIVAILSVTGYYNIPGSEGQERYQVTFEKCVDGDTAYFKVGNESKKYRFLAIDTPETVHPTKKTEKYGKNASEYTCNKLTNAKIIEVEYDPNSDKEDKYNRQLVWVWTDNELLQEQLIEIGYAEVAYIYGDYKYTEQLCDTQQNAKEEKLGIWNGSRKEGYCSTIK